MLRSNLRKFNDLPVAFEGTITDTAGITVIFKVNKSRVDQASKLDLTMLKYNLIVYSE